MAYRIELVLGSTQNIHSALKAGEWSWIRILTFDELCSALVNLSIVHDQCLSASLNALSMTSNCILGHMVWPNARDITCPALAACSDGIGNVTHPAGSKVGLSPGMPSRRRPQS